jgi:UDP-MurNAc hydroxylase
MIVGRIGHASLAVHTRQTACLMDPIFEDSFECGTNRFHPPVAVDIEAVRKRFDLVVISHEHMDHFSVRSLAHLDRATPVVFPRGAKLIEMALKRMQFADRRSLGPGEGLTVRDLTIAATPSNVSFPEMGILFTSEGQSFWNPVDSVINERTQVVVKKLCRALDLMFAYYQPLIELPMMQDALGGEFPYEQYGRFLCDVMEVGPRCVVPGACGFKYALNDWQNDRGFPMTARQFLADVEKLDPAISTRIVPHGAVINVGDGFSVQTDALDYVRRVGQEAGDDYQWRPYRGVPVLVDQNPFGHEPRMLREKVIAYLEGPFVERLSAIEHAVWLARMSSLKMVWELELVFPDGDCEVRWLEFGPGGARWSRTCPGRLSSIISCVPASTILGLLEGELNAYSANLTRRVALRMYGAHRSGVTQIGSAADEPLARALFPGAERRFVERELDRLGYREGATQRSAERAAGWVGAET